MIPVSSAFLKNVIEKYERNNTDLSEIELHLLYSNIYTPHQVSQLTVARHYSGCLTVSVKRLNAIFVLFSICTDFIVAFYVYQSLTQTC